MGNPTGATIDRIAEVVAVRFSGQTASEPKPIEEFPTTLLSTSTTSLSLPETYEMDRSIEVEANIGRIATVAGEHNEFEQLFHEAVQNVDRYISKLKMVQTDFGEDITSRRNQIIDCYKTNFDCPLKCSEEALAFRNCVVNLTMDKLNKVA